MDEKKRIEDVGEVSGKLLFFGGVYGNLQALSALKEYADLHRFDPSRIFCTGDIMGYCAQPSECVKVIKDWKIQSIAGNVELQIRDDKEDCGCEFTSGGRCDLFSRNWYNYTRAQISHHDREWLWTLPEIIGFSCNGLRFTIVHGSWFNTADFIFKSTPWQEKQENLVASNADIIVAGHCGLPFAEEVDGLFWLNPGVIGMPANDGTPRVWFLTLEMKEGKPLYQFHHLIYDYEITGRLMVEKGLPLSYANSLSTGIWDNCEILPETETKAQGKALSL